MRLPAKDETMHATHVAKGLFRLNSLPASFLNIKRKSRLVNPLKAKTKKKFCFLLKFSVFRKFFPIKIIWQNLKKNRKIFCKNPEIMDRKTEKKFSIGHKISA